MPAKKPFSKAQELEIVSMYLEGKSTPMLADQYGIATATVARILRDHGQKLRSRSESSALRANRSPGGSPQNGRYCVFQSQKNRKWIFAASTYEYMRMQQLEDDDDVIAFDRCNDRICYTLHGKTHHYTPDLTVRFIDGRIVVEEVKPQSLVSRIEVKTKAAAAEAFYARHGASYQIVTEEVIGREYMNDFEWSGISGLCQAELDNWQRQQTRKRATAWARKKRAAQPMNDEQKAEHARRTRDYYDRWKDSATEEQKAAKRQRAAELARKYRAARKASSKDGSNIHQNLQ